MAIILKEILLPYFSDICQFSPRNREKSPWKMNKNNKSTQRCNKKKKLRSKYMKLIN